MVEIKRNIELTSEEKSKVLEIFENVLKEYQTWYNLEFDKRGKMKIEARADLFMQGVCTSVGQIIAEKFPEDNRDFRLSDFCEQIIHQYMFEHLEIVYKLNKDHVIRVRVEEESIIPVSTSNCIETEPGLINVAGDYFISSMFAFPPSYAYIPHRISMLETIIEELKTK